MRVGDVNTFTKNDLHKVLVEVIKHILDWADPYRAVIDSVKLSNNRLFVRGNAFTYEGQIHVIGFGKAAKRMGEAIYSIAGDNIVGGVLISPEDEGLIGRIKLLRGDHPLPKQSTLRSSLELLNYIKDVKWDDLVLVLISGGGSSLFELPEEGLTLDDIAYVSKELMRRGANIYELNTVRKRLSKVKGGKLLKYIKSKYVISLIISDVVGDRLDTVASGPTSPDETTPSEAYNILQKYKLLDDLPHIKKHLLDILAGLRPDTLKPTDTLFNRVFNYIILNNHRILELIDAYLRNLGFNTLILTSMLEGEAREVGRFLASIIKSVHRYGVPIGRPAAIIAGGETTVTIRGGGMGGRNQELCLSLAIHIQQMPNTVAMCLATDGIDGNSPAAGAIVDGNTVQMALRRGLDPMRYLEDNNSYSFFSELGQSIVVGPTGTNVNDIFLAMIK